MLPAFLVFVALLTSPTTALTGRVRTADDVPVPGAAVIAHQADRVFTTTTNERGEFSLPDVALPAAIEVRAAGFTTVRQQIASSPADITLVPSPIRESVFVAGSAISDAWRRAATGTTVLTPAAIESIPSVTLDEALRVVSGFSLFRRSASRASNPTTHGVTMRGLSASGASRGLVLFDGVPLTDGFGSWVTWTRLPALALSTVEVDRGAQGSTFGSDALGGVLTLSSRSADRPMAIVGATGGSLGIASVDVAGGTPRSDASLFGALSWFRTDGVVPTAPESAGLVDIRADASWVNGFGKARFGSSVDQIVLSAWAGRDERGNGTPLQRNRMAGGTIALTYDRLVAGTAVGAKVSLSPNAFRQSFSSPASNRNSETLTSTQFINTTTTRVVTEVGRAVPHGYITARYAHTRAGADFLERRATSAVSMVLLDDSDAVSVHAGWSPRDDVSIGAGIRGEWREAPRNTSGRDSATVGHVSASWRLSPRLVARGAASTSHRWPTLNEMVRNFQAGAVLTRANPDLLPERARSAEGALAVSGRSWQASVAGFWSLIEDAIANVTIQTTPSIIRERRNAGEAHAKGVEIDFDFRPVTAVTIRASGLIVDSRFRNSQEPALEGNWLPQVPRSTVSLIGDARLTSWVSASFAWRAIAPQFDDDRNVFRLTEAKQLDLRFKFGTPTWSCDLTVENAADARIEVGRTPLVTLAPGRAFRVHATWRR